MEKHSMRWTTLEEVKKISAQAMLVSAKNKRIKELK